MGPFPPGLGQLGQGLLVIFLLQILGRLLHQHIIFRADSKSRDAGQEDPYEN